MALALCKVATHSAGAQDQPVTSEASIELAKALRPDDDHPKVLLFVKGAYCVHCMAHLKRMAASVPENVHVTVFSGSDPEDLKGFPDVPFKLIADPQLKQFAKFGLAGEEMQHGTIVLDNRVGELYRHSGKKPLSDVAPVLAALGYWEAGKQTGLRPQNSADQRSEHRVTWAIDGSKKQPVSSSDLLGQNYVLVLLEDLDNLHCAQAINLFSRASETLEQLSVPTIFVIARSSDLSKRSLGSSESTFKFLADPDKSVWEACHLNKKKSPVCLLVCDRTGQLQSLHYRATDDDVRAVIHMLKQLQTKTQSEISE